MRRLTLAQRIPIPSFTRNTYSVPSLTNHGELEQRGIPGLLTPQGFKTAYTDYQQHMIDELNESTAGTPYENQDPKSLVIEFARDPTRAYAFNVASMAFNNHFFFRGINTSPDVQSRPSEDLEMQINKDFSSRDTLRETFLATAEAMFGPGFVWLVQTNDTQFGSLRIVPTYLAGSPLSGAHYRRQSHDLNTHNAETYQELNKVGSFGRAAKQQPQGPKKPLGGVDVVPLMCVNTWEHVWLHDYGVKGKRAFLEAWWDKIDWELVRQHATLTSRQSSGQQKFVYEL
ncbi:Fe superoxide dismutase-like protein [Plenodomus tracheiphilus IPT5]|uniref:Fe superoxide dismutase-like protein n=1 Tax=Plenodomus tracheiphilus IPT5 TaxID=1408161 RepID=A0A6A7BHM9_9PLEO|nr:Fe superoxide dismutase-like protein [Plenodomus tracheiphilus IPT5]